MDKIKNIKPFYDGGWKCIKRKCSFTVIGAKSGKNNFESFYNSSHLETNNFQKTLLGVGSAIASLANPRRGDMIAALGETTGLRSMEYIRSKMSNSTEGSKILNEKPRISSNTLDLKYLSTLKDHTVGKSYYEFLKKYNYSPDGRLAVRFVDDIELAYIIQRYREVHDLFHTILNMPTNMLGEVTVKWVEAVQTKLPMCAGGAIFGAARLSPKYSRQYSTLHHPHSKFDFSFKISEEHSMEKVRCGSLRMPCIELPEKLSIAIRNIIKERNLPHLADKSKDMYNYLHSRNAPLSLESYRLKKASFKAEITDAISVRDDMTEDEKEHNRNIISSKINGLLRSRIYHWKPLVFDDKLSFYYLVARASAEYAVVSRVFNEILQRDSTFVPKSIFDFGSGMGSVSWVAHHIWGDSIKEHFTVDCSPAMHDLARLILQLNNSENNLLIKNLFQRQFLPSAPRKYDLVVSSFSLMELESVKARGEVIVNLWSKTGKYLVIIEQGTNAGFKLVNEVRDIILHSCQNGKEECHVFAPCPHEVVCPILDKLPLTPCNFSLKYKDNITNSVPKAERFSFVILKKGKREENDQQWPRVIRDVLRRHKHTICRLCTKNGKLDEKVFTKSKHGKDLYKHIRHASWGDLIPVEIENNNEPKKGTSETE